MNEKQYVGTAILALALIGAGWVAHAGLFPQNTIRKTEVEVFVDRVIEVPTEKENHYTQCERVSYRTFFSNWNGDMKDGIEPKDIESFMEHGCYK